LVIKPVQNFSGIVRIPGDKSVAHRAIILSAIAQGTAKITGAPLGTDVLATVDCVSRLGAKVENKDGALLITGTDKNLKSGQKLYAGASATTMRLLMGLLSGAGISAVLDGTESLRRRPVEKLVAPLVNLGAKITATNGFAPVNIKSSRIAGGKVIFSEESNTAKTALMLAGLYSKNGITICDGTMAGDSSELLFSSMSADIERGPEYVTVRPSRLKSVNIKIPGDISCAAYYIVAATVIPDSHIVLKNVGMNPARTAIVNAVNSCGGRVTMLNKKSVSGEKTADLLVEYSPSLKPFDIDKEQSARLINELPVLAVMACFAPGRSRISCGPAARRAKTDRIESVVSALRAMGARISTEGDDIVVDGGGILNGGAVLDPEGDHRIAMTMAVAAAASLEGADILTPEVVNMGYPGFFEEFLRKA
jgi:3-phosphoshikimate 1-carboxyvinyltransferase